MVACAWVVICACFLEVSGRAFIFRSVFVMHSFRSFFIVFQCVFLFFSPPPPLVCVFCVCLSACLPWLVTFAWPVANANAIAHADGDVNVNANANVSSNADVKLMLMLMVRLSLMALLMLMLTVMPMLGARTSQPDMLGSTLV